MRRIATLGALLIAISLFAGWTGQQEIAASGGPQRPDWCREGWECVPTQQRDPAWCQPEFACLTAAKGASLYKRIEDLEQEVSRQKAACHRWGGVVGGGASYNPFTDSACLGVSYTWGLRIR